MPEKKDKEIDISNLSEEQLQSLLKKVNFFGMMESGDVSEFSEVVNAFFSSNKDIQLKTELHRPRNMSILDVWILVLEMAGLEETAKIWKKFRISYLENMVSYDRGGRREFVDIVKEFKDKLEEQEVQWD